MTAAGPEETRQDEAPLSLARLVLIVLVGALVVVRLVLPYGLRPLLLARADEALVGRIEVADLDLSLLRGGVTLHGLEIHADEHPAKTPPVFEARRLWTQISWLALLSRTVDIEEFEVEGFVVRLDREPEGFRLPALAAARREGKQDEAPAPEASAPRDWSFGASSASLFDGRIEFVDHTMAGTPEKIEVEIADLSARELAVESDAEDDEPGRISIEAMLDRGSFALSTWIQRTDAGIDARSTLVLDDLPIDKLRAYAKDTRWSSLSGTLDATLDHRYEPGGVHDLEGKITLANLAIGVPDADVPALAWKELALVVESIDLAKRRVAISSLTSDGAHLLVTPRAKTPLPLLAPPDPPADGAQSEGEEDDGETRVDAETGTSNAWTWTLADAKVRAATIELRGAPEPVFVTLEADAAALATDAEKPGPIALRLAQGDGTLRFEGSLAPDPLALEGRLEIADVALPVLLGPFEAAGLHWLARGTLRGDLTVALAEDLRANGQLGIARLDLEEATSKKLFGVEWKDLELSLARMRLRDPLRRSPQVAAATLASPVPRPLEIELAKLTLVEPEVVLARDARGWILPPSSPQSASEAATAQPARDADPDADEGDAAPPEFDAGEPDEPVLESTSASPIEPRVRIAALEIVAGQGRWIDRKIEPSYRGRITRLDATAKGVAWPQTKIESLELEAEGLGDAKLVVTGSIDPEESNLEGRVDSLAMAQFNPYLVGSGYDLESGALAIESRARIRPKRFRTRSKLSVESLALRGAEAESTFKESFGIPLSVARGLLEDLDGRITLDVPVRGSADAVEVGFGSIVGQALRKALVGALAAPLKLIGASLREGKVDSGATPPIPFAVGESTPTDDARPRIEALAELLARSPGITLLLTGQISEADDRLLCERALLAQLEAGRGVRALSELGEIGRRRNVREFLSNKHAGREATPLSKGDRRWLAKQLAQARAGRASLEALADARARQLRDQLAREHGVAPERVALGTPVVDTPVDHGSVAIALGASTPL